MIQNHGGAGGGDEDGYNMATGIPTHRDVRNWAAANLSLGDAARAALLGYVVTQEASLIEAQAKQRSAELGLELFQQSAAAVEERCAELRDVFGQIADAVNENCDDLEPSDLLQLVVALETERDSLRTENKDQLAELRDLRMVFGYADALLDELTESVMPKLTAYAQRLVPKLREMVEVAQWPTEAAPGAHCEVVPAVVYVGPSPVERPPSCRHVRPRRPSYAEPHCVLPAGHKGDHAAMSVDDAPAGPRWVAETGIMSGHGHWGAVGADLHRCNWVSGYGNRCSLPHPHDGAHATAPQTPTAQRAEDFITRADLAAIMRESAATAGGANIKIGDILTYKGQRSRVIGTEGYEGATKRACIEPAPFTGWVSADEFERRQP